MSRKQNAKALQASGIKTLYVSGPMSGIPDNNTPAFAAASKELRALGFAVISPAELDSTVEDEDSIRAGDELWLGLLARDCAIVSTQIDGVAVIEGWTRSSGARIETFIAGALAKPVLFASSLQHVPRGRIEAPPVLRTRTSPTFVPDGDIPAASQAAQVRHARQKVVA
jgi:hypothetical protein